MSVGKAVLPYSDMDLLLLSTSRDIQGQGDRWMNCKEELERLLQGAVDLVDLQLVPFDVPGPIVEKCLLHARLQSTWLCGSLDFPIEPVRLNAYFYEVMWGGTIDGLHELYYSLQRGKTLEWSGKHREANFWCRWAMRDALRMLAGQVTMKTGVYTSHLTSCMALVAEYSPLLKEEVYVFRRAEMFPPSDLRIVLALIYRAIEVLKHADQAWREARRDIVGCCGEGQVSDLCEPMPLPPSS